MMDFVMKMVDPGTFSPPESMKKFSASTCEIHHLKYKIPRF